MISSARALLTGMPRAASAKFEICGSIARRETETMRGRSASKSASWSAQTLVETMRWGFGVAACLAWVSTPLARLGGRGVGGEGGRSREVVCGAVIADVNALLLTALQ